MESDNQKKKDFPIFKFTIAVIIVSIILVIMVMQMIGGVGPSTGQKSMAIDALSNAVKLVNPDGEVRVQNFVLKKGVVVDNVDLAMRTDLGEGSFIFFTNGVLPDVESMGGICFEYKGSQKEVILSARVVCKSSAGELEMVLKKISNEFPRVDIDVDLCDEGLVCCAIIPLEGN